jgi:hypothetical protein
MTYKILLSLVNFLRKSIISVVGDLEHVVMYTSGDRASSPGP